MKGFLLGAMTAVIASAADLEMYENTAPIQIEETVAPAQIEFTEAMDIEIESSVGRMEK